MNVKILKATIRPPQDEETNLMVIAHAALARIRDWYGVDALRQQWAVLGRKLGLVDAEQK